MVNRVNGVDRDKVRVAQLTDHRMVMVYNGDKNFRFGNRLISIFKTLTGISSYKFNRNIKRTMRQLRIDQMERNNARARQAQSE